jgi:uncharacterized protein (TIGR02118 family)
MRWRTPMPAKIVVLYPPPLDVLRFETQYQEQHLPLVRQLMGPNILMPTYKVVSLANRAAPFYRMAEIHFPTLPDLLHYAQSPPSRTGRESAERVSSGGPPIIFLCDEQPEKNPSPRT